MMEEKKTSTIDTGHSVLQERLWKGYGKIMERLWKDKELEQQYDRMEVEHTVNMK